MDNAKYIPPGISLKGGSSAVAFVSQLPGNPEKIFSVPEAAKHLQKTISALETTPAHKEMSLSQVQLGLIGLKLSSLFSRKSSHIY